MQLYRVAIASTIGLVSLLTFSKPATTAPAPFFAVLAGGNEVKDNGPANQGDPKGFGSATVTINSSEELLCYGLTVGGIKKATSAHIHKGAAGVNGPVVVPLKQPPNTPGASSDCIKVERSVLEAIQSDPSGFYINIHNSDFPGGAIRGQLF